MLETAGTGINVIDFRAADFQSGFNDAMLRNDEPRIASQLARFTPRSWQLAMIRSHYGVH
jgi:hypothetical protein